MRGAREIEQNQPIDRIMDRMPAWGSEFAATFANHAPMVLVALDRIGADEDRLEDFFARYNDYKALLPALEAVSPVTRDSWKTAIGQRGREADLRAFFKAEVAANGVEATLRAYLPVLAPGVGASAFHALMRLAYALMRQDADEVAYSLGYWAACYLPMPPSTGAPPVTADPAEALARVSAIPELHDLRLQPLLWQNMREAGHCPAFAPVVDWIELGPGGIERLASGSIALFAATQHFCALHAVTGLHWLRVVLPYCPDPDVMLRAFWQCVSALMGEMRFPTLPDAATFARWRAIPVPSWDEIWAVARQSYDEHDISIAYSAHEEMKIYGDPLYQVAAARRVGLIGDYR